MRTCSYFRFPPAVVFSTEQTDYRQYSVQKFMIFGRVEIGKRGLVPSRNGTYLQGKDAHGPFAVIKAFQFFLESGPRNDDRVIHHHILQPAFKGKAATAALPSNPPTLRSAKVCKDLLPFFFFSCLCSPYSLKMSSIWNALTGQKSNKTSSSQQNNAPPTTPEPTTTFSSPAFDPSSAQGVDTFLNSSTFADPSQLHPLAGLDKDALEYITLEESVLSDLPGGQSVLPSRGFTDDLCYGTGITYLSALTIGGAWGMQEGLRRSAGQAPKLRLNSTLNAITRRGPFLGNSAGVVAIIYNCFNSYLGYLRGKHDWLNSVGAGALSGMLFKCTRGLRPMGISGLIVGSVAGVWAVSPVQTSTFAFRSDADVSTVHEEDSLPRTTASPGVSAPMNDDCPS